MYFYLTEISASRLKKEYNFLFKDRKTKILEYNKILDESWYSYLDNYECLVRYIYQLKFEMTIKKLYKLKYQNIVYIVKNINRKLLYDLKIFLNESNLYIIEFNLIDNDNKYNDKIYKFFDNIF